MAVLRDAQRAVGSIVCDGRPVDANLQPTGPACGKTLHQRDIASPFDSPLAVARAAGWAIGPDDSACCPACRKPDRTPVNITAFKSTEE
jgi:hypothetical protein